MIHNWMLKFQRSALVHHMQQVDDHWDPQKLQGTLIWPDMWVPGPRLKTPAPLPLNGYTGMPYTGMYQSHSIPSYSRDFGHMDTRQKSELQTNVILMT